MGYPHVARLSTDLESTFGTTAAGGYRDQRMVEGSFTPRFQKGRLANQTVVDRLHDVQQLLDASLFGSGFDVSVYLDGLAAALDNATAYAHPQTGAAEILGALFGGNRGDSGSLLVAAGSTTTTLNVTGGQGGRLAKGGALVIQTSGGWEMREIKDVVVDAVTLKMALNAVPANGTPIYNCATFYLDEDNVGGDGDSLMFRFLGLLANDQWTAQGCGGTVKFGTALDALLTMQLGIQAATWAKTSGHTLAGASYVGGGPLVCKAGRLWWQTVGTTTRNILSADSFDVDPGLSIVAERALDGIETVKRWRMLRAAPTATLEVSAFRGATEGADFDSFWTEFATATTVKAFLLQLGDAPIVAGSGTGLVGISLPRCMYSEAPERLGSGDLVHARVKLRGDEDTDITSPDSGQTATADLHRSAIRVHLA